MLARRAEIGFDGDLDATLLLESLEEATPSCFHFYVEPESGVAFLGASPERLFRREGSSVVSEAVAGTRPRGVSSEDDEGLRDDLLHSAEDRSEHAYVRTGIGEALAPLCEELEIERRRRDEAGAGQAPEVQGARHPQGGRYRRGPARGAASDARRRWVSARRGAGRDQGPEPFDRGLYAGPVGWIGAEASEFAVGITVRARPRGRTLALFSGAGIVAGSVPDEEWAEIEQKIGDFTGMFGLEQGNAAS